MSPAKQSKVEKATLTLVEPSATGGGKASLGKVEFQFNPKEYTDQKTASWKANPSKGAKKTSMPEFTGTEPRSMTIEAFFDASEKLDVSNGKSTRDIAKDIKTLFRCCVPLDHTVGKNRPSPPFVDFRWGKTIKFRAYVKQVSAKYTLFKPDGTPIRAVCSISLQEIPTPAGPQNPTSGSRELVRTRTVMAGDSLPSIAYDEYGDPAMWRVVARSNGIDDPMRVPVGTELLLPGEPAAVAAEYVRP